MPFSIPHVAPKSDSWGPPALNDGDDTTNGSSASDIDKKYALLPYSPFGRSDRLGRAADFTSSGTNRYSNQNYNQSRTYRRKDAEQPAAAAAAEPEVDANFQLVDTTKAHAPTTKRFVNPAVKRQKHSLRLRQINARRMQSSGGGTTVTLDKVGGRGGRGGRGRGSGGRGAGRGRGGRGYQNNNNNSSDRQPSVAVRDDWVQVEQIDLAKLTKNLTASDKVPTAEDLLWCGFLDPYNDAYDKVSAKQPVPLKRVENKEFYPVTTTDDPVLEKLAIDGVGNIFVTDTILAHLMTCTRSVYPWDLVLQKLPNGTIFIDKRDNSSFDYYTVNETAYNTPNDNDGINSPERLALEATMVNQNFSQQILIKKNVESVRVNFDLPNPFFDEDDPNGMEPASTAFRYRKFSLDDKNTVVVRTELHGIVKKTQQHMTAFCLNEYIPDSSAANSTYNTTSWRDQIDNQRGAVLATELKNNAFKLAKWTAQSLLADAEQMKIGFCSRTNPKSAYEHQILATQFYRPREFATQITLGEPQMWAVFRMFVHLVQKQKENGKYVLMREPNKTMLNLYKVPAHTFEDDDDEEEDE